MITALAEAFENIDTFLLQIMKNINSDANKQLKKKKKGKQGFLRTKSLHVFIIMPAQKLVKS